jgi:3-hydroxyisobutyrate dehydrogenase
MDIRTVGVIGLGNMGLGMAATLARSGFTTIGTDIDPARRAAAQDAGVGFRTDLSELLRQADVLVFSLPFARDVEAVVTAPGGLLQRADRRVIVIDTSTSDPGTSRRLARQLATAGHGLLDAPVMSAPPAPAISPSW